MKKRTLLFILLLFLGCDERQKTSVGPLPKNEVRHAKGLSIYNYDGFSVVNVSNPWPNATQGFTYVLQKKGAVIPDSLNTYPIISVPVRKMIATSTTHIPSLVMLGVQNSLIGFPNTEFVSSEPVRSRIDSGKVKEVGSTQNLNTEIIIDLAPEVIVAHGIDNHNPALDNLRKSGLKVMMNGDWNEQTALGKAEWIKFFGALYGLDKKAATIFNSIETEYNNTLELVKKAEQKPTVLSGAIYESKWYLPQGESWGALLIAQAGGDYLWKETKGSGSLSLPFESVLDKAKDAQVWIGPGQYTSFDEMAADNPHYKQFTAFVNRQVYSYSSKKGKTGGVVYFELAPNRPDMVVKDLVKILHPDLLPDHQLYFFEKLK